MAFDKEKALKMCNDYSKNTLMETLGIVYTDAAEGYLQATMPVTPRVHQPMGLLHGGATVALAETLGSIGAQLAVDQSKYACVGLEINANHIRSVKEGFVYGKVTPLHVGRSTQIWEIKITNEENKLVCVSRLTVAIVDANR